MIKFFRIFAHVTAFPALLAFFYIIIKGLGNDPETGSRVVSIVEAILVLTVPIFFNRLAWLLARSRKGQNL